ncbi:YgdI/YgdR family lipoprotein [Qipengyuania gaetbuli]|uniref:YgdI/YgdR family lipoprotein n=1 Tax=Qipengyuania gaetbuli TaxID=266952 RepID=UPI001CD4F397|nr:YgdI/YgdR family lipoprotein [Qipengyuania gaetbuli]MCA0911317.1 YgdI/YgdR family lipoprotein [Qipengyuania gaetbuli]
MTGGDLQGRRLAAATLVIATLALAACNAVGGNEASEPEAPDPASIAGSYEATLEDGRTIIHTLNEDGTYRDLDGDGNPVETGTWRLAEGEICYDPEGSDPEACFAGGPSGKVRRVERPALEATE